MIFAKDDRDNVMIDGDIAGSFQNSSLLLPVGIHSIKSKRLRFNPWWTIKSRARLVDISADLLKTVVTSLGLEVTYWADRRSVIVFNKKPLTVTFDGVKTKIRTEEGQLGWAMMLPKGKHTVYIKTRTLVDLLLVIASLAVSNTILLISLVAISILTFIAVVTVIRTKTRKMKRA
jgi:hypothetical protein